MPLGGGQLSGYRPIAEVLREPTALLTPVTRGELARRAAACGTDPNPLMTPLARQRTTLGDGGQP